jgi:hypothetical protein
MKQEQQMTVRKAPGNSNHPKLRRWRVMEVVFRNGTRSRHIWGHEVTQDEGRASTAIVKFDPETMTATTNSGSVYKLEGAPGNPLCGKYVWRNWCQIHGVTSELDVTGEYFELDE